MNRNFRYPELSGNKAIRLIRIHEVANNLEPLRFTFLETNLDSPTPYLALSYVWGTVKGPGKLIPLVLRAGEADMVSDTTPQRFWATPNCAAALRTLAKNGGRLKDKPVWVDAICIDQNTPSEKNVQVAMMASIYRRAHIIIIWLGSVCAPKSHDEIPCNDSVRTRVTARFSGTRNLAVRRVAECSILFHPRSQNELANLVCLASDAKRVELMMKAEYWTRVWTLQEAVYDSTEFLCQNGDTISGTMVFDILNYTISRTRRPPSDEQSSIVLRQRLLKSPISKNGARSKLAGRDRMQLDFSIIPELQGLSSSELRDKVYALRDLFPNTLADLQVRYDDPVPQVYMDATKCCIRHHGLSILTFAGTPLLPTGLPSWVVNWSETTQFNVAGLMSLQASASGNSETYWNYNQAFSGPPGELWILGRQLEELPDQIFALNPLPEREDRDSLHQFSRALRFFYTQEFDHTPLRKTTSDTTETLARITAANYHSLIASRFGLPPVPEPSHPAAGEIHTERQDTEPKDDPLSLRMAEIHEAMEIDSLNKYVQGKIAKLILWTLDKLDRDHDFKDANTSFLAKESMDNLTESDKASLLSVWATGDLFLTTMNDPGLCTNHVRLGDRLVLLAGCSHPFVIRPATAGTFAIVGAAICEGAMEGELWHDDLDLLDLFRLV